MIEIILIVLVVIALILVGWIIAIINKIIRLQNRVKNAWAQIDVQLKKRGDLVPNLVETVKGYAKHEKSTFENVTKARAAMANANGVADKAAANNLLSGALKSLFAVAEAYPELKASENFKLLQEQLDGIESKIAYARQFYNDSVMEFNNYIQQIPGRFFAGSRQSAEFFEIAEGEKAVPKVKFD
jgi:LemA protein